MIKVSDYLEKVAEKVLNNAFPVKEKEKVTFVAGTHNLDLAYAFAGQCAVRGIEALVVSTGDYIINSKLRKSPVSLFERAPHLLSELVKNSDWFVSMMGTHHDLSIKKEPELQERLKEIELKKIWTQDYVLQLCLKHKTHLLAFLDPYLQQAETLKLTFEETRQKFLKSLDIDYAALTELGEKIIKRMKGAKEIHLTSPKGTDLYFSPGQRPWINDDGKTTPPKGVTHYIHNLPVGETFVAPIENSADGILIAENFPGNPIEDMKVEFYKNKPAVITARKGFSHVETRLKKATGNPYCIAEFAIGTNPCGDPLLATEKAYGTCHVAIGQNIWLGGKNDCSVHWDLLVDNPTVKVDGNYLLKGGKFKL